MTLIRSLDDIAPARGCVLSIGNFDGVHRGHQTMVGKLVSLAKKQNAQAAVLTFDPHPIKLLAPEKAPPSLSTLARKSELLHQAGADFVIAVPTSRDLLDLDAVIFFEQIVIDQLRAIGLVEGPNFFFGKNRQGDTALLQTLCNQHGLTCHILDAVGDGPMISSSLIRSAITDGRLDDAVHWLGHPYQVQGQVVAGDARGRTLGYPTANLEQIETLLPPDGVYAASCNVDGARYPAAVNIGGNPTFGIDARKVEVHLLDFDANLYGRTLAVDIISKVRGVKTFESRDSLIEQLESDLQTIRDSIANH